MHIFTKYRKFKMIKLLEQLIRKHRMVYLTFGVLIYIPLYFIDKVKWNNYRYWMNINLRYPQRKLSYGNDNPDKIFFVIGMWAEYEGHFSVISAILGYLEYAQRKNWIPVIDMKNFYSRVWQNKAVCGKENAFEYYYLQPAGYGLEDIGTSKNIILSNASKIPAYNPQIFNSDYDKNVKAYHHIYNQYIKMNDLTNSFIDGYFKKFQLSSRRVLAVSIRRDYEWGHIMKQENVQYAHKAPLFHESIIKIKQRMLDWKCDFCFLSIDDCEGLEILKEALGDTLLYIERNRRVYFEHNQPIKLDEKFYVKNSKHNGLLSQEEINDKELKYVAEVHIMAKCSCFYGAKCTTAKMALIINGGKFENVEIDEGKV